jgi:hypothetical protein
LTPDETIYTDDLYNLGYQSSSSEYRSDGKLGGTIEFTCIAESIRPRSGNYFFDSSRLYERVGGTGKKVEDEEESEIEVYVLGPSSYSD